MTNSGVGEGDSISADARFIGLIPARAGSKGLPGKNWLEYGGRSLVAWAIGCARDTHAIREIYVSSDDPRAGLECARFGATHVPRSPSAATDEATAADVVRDFLDLVDASTWNEDTFIAYLQPTSPLRTGGHVTMAIETLLSSAAKACVSVVSAPANPFKCVSIDDQGLVRPLLGSKLVTANRQSLPKVYIPNGAIYIFQCSLFRSTGEIPIEGAVPFVMSPEESLDIDDEYDMQRLLNGVTASG